MYTVGRRHRRPLLAHQRVRHAAAGVGASIIAVVLLAAWSGRSESPAAPALTQADVVAWRDTPGINAVTSEIIGYSLLGAPIEAFSVGSGPIVVAIIGGLHTGSEMATVDVTRSLLEAYQSEPLPEAIQLVFIPLVNPDGVGLDQRVNARGVDLNRNWPTGDWSAFAVHSGEEVYAGTSPLSEPETAALFWHLNTLRPAMTLSFHGYAGIVDDNGVGAAPDLARTYSVAAEYEHIEEWSDYTITGQMIDALAEIGLPAADVELIEGDSNDFSRNLAAIQAVIAALVTS